MRAKTKRIILRVLRILAVALLAVAAVFAFEGFHQGNRLTALESSNPLVMETDLSVPGEYEGVLRQTYSGSHGQQFRLAFDPPFPPSEEDLALSALDGLDAHLLIASAAGTAVLVAWRLSKHLHGLHASDINPAQPLKTP